MSEATYQDVCSATRAEGIPDTLSIGDFTSDEIALIYDSMTSVEQDEFNRLLKSSPPRALMPHQTVPLNETWWEVMLLIGGRGVGKTVTGAYAVRNHLRLAGKSARIGVAAPTNSDARDTCAEGEALALDTPIPTPHGWTTMGQVKKGDMVFDENGGIQTVELVSDVKHGRPCYRVEFNDGSCLVTDAKHKWLSYNKEERAAYGRNTVKHRPKVRTTEYMTTGLYTAKKNELNYAIPVAGPINYDEKKLPIHPYVLGVWLGDGLSKSAAVCTMDDEIIELIRSAGYETTEWADTNSGKAKIYGILGLKKQLRENNLVRNKHIPDIYLLGSFAQRLELIRGLMDTDGYVSERGQCAFDNSNLEIVENLKELLLSCGVKVGKISTKTDSRKDTYKLMYRITFSPSIGVFNLARKFKRQILVHAKTAWRHIENIVTVKSTPVKCIKVSGPSELYLAGKEFIPTHNTGLITMFPNEFKYYNRSLGEARHIDGGFVKFMGTEKPKRWNGPQWSMIWFDELALCNQAAWDDANLGLRLGARPYAVCTTTPKNRKWVKALATDATTYVPQYIDDETGHLRLPSTFDNKFLPQRRVDWLRNKYMGSRLGRQELLGQFVDDIEGAMWKRDWIVHETDPTKWPRFLRIIVAVDPAGSRSRRAADANAQSEEDRQNQRKNADTGLAVVALGADKKFYVLALKSGQWTPNEWGREAIRLFHRFKADKIVAESNYGGLMVEATIRNIDEWDAKARKQIKGEFIPIKLVTASRGKDIRAEPVATLYEQRRFIHGLMFAEGEDQMCFTGDTMVSAGQIDKVSRRLYNGTLITVKTKDRAIEATASHPFLTQRGWVKAQDLTDEDTLYYAEEHLRVHERRIEDLYETLSNQGHQRDSRVDGQTFTVGEGFISPSAVCWPKNLCTADDFEAVLNKPRESGISGGTDRRRGNGQVYSWLRRAVSQASHRGLEYFMGLNGVVENANRLQGFVYQQETNSGWSGYVPVQFSGPGLSSALREDMRLSPHQAAAHAGSGRVGQDTNDPAKNIGQLHEQAAAISDTLELFESSRIESVGSREVENVPVYNLTTDTNWYLAEGHIVHNCSFVDGDENEGADMVDALVWATTELMGLGGVQPGMMITPGDTRLQSFVVY